MFTVENSQYAVSQLSVVSHQSEVLTPAVVEKTGIPGYLNGNSFTVYFKHVSYNYFAATMIYYGTIALKRIAHTIPD